MDVKLNKEMKNIIYVLVYIEGKEENLPKESGVYFVEKNDFEKGLRYFDPNSKGKLQEYDIEYWMEFVRAWLKPVELPDEEEIIRKCADTLINRQGLVNIHTAYAFGFKDAINWFKSQILEK